MNSPYRTLKIKIAVLALSLVGTLAPVQAAVIHRYELNGTFADALGGPSLVPGGIHGMGTLSLADYSFLENQGLSLSNALPNPSNYSLLIDFSFETTAAYRKIVDFLDATSDTGLYVLNGELEFYPVVTGTGGPFQDDVPARVVLTRDGTTQEVVGYVNGVPYFNFNDAGGDAVFNGPNNIITFFNDDATTSGESSPGKVDRIVIYDAPLSSTEVAALGAIPEPTSIVLMLLGGVGLLARHRRAV